MQQSDAGDPEPMIRVYADMVGDLFHYGHVEFLRQASALGDHVMVGVNSDSEAAAHKRRPAQVMEDRIAAVAACEYVDEVIPNAPWVFDATWIGKYQIDLVVHGDDYSDEQRRDLYGTAIDKGIFRTVAYTNGVSTTEILRSRNLRQKLESAETSIGIADVTP